MKQFKTESKRILDLMINSIYTNKEIFLRELISNASDAIDKIRFISLTDNNVNSDFKINLSFDKENKQIIIEDNGIGMNEADLEKNLGTIAESGTLIQESYIDTASTEIEQLLLQQKALKAELNRIDRTLNDNKRFKKFIAEMKRSISLPLGV